MLEQVISNKADWTRVAFGDVVRKVSDKIDPWKSGLERYVAGDHMDTDDLRIRRWGLIGDDYLGPAFHMRFKRGHVLYGSRRTYLRKVAFADFEGITANTTYVLESKDPNVLMPELLPFIMQTEAFHAHSIARSKGSVNPYVNFSDIACFEFLLPPLQEQARILSVLSSSRASTYALEELASRQGSVLQSAILDELQRCEAKPAAIGDFAHRVTNGFVGSAVKHYVDDGIPYLRSLNVRRRGLALNDLVYISDEFHEKTKKSQLKEGDLLTVQSGHVGETAVVPARCEGWNCHALILTRLNLDTANPDFCALYLNSALGQRELQRFHIGSTVAHLNTSDLAKFRIPLPELDEQKRIAELGRVLLSKVEETERRASASRHLFGLLLGEALTTGGPA